MLQFCWNQTNQSAKFPINSVILLSLPVWECGLKFTIGQEQPTVLASLPVWECGLKFGWNIRCKEVLTVTPRVGVWIEIINSTNRLASPLVTPRVGVWIEMKNEGIPCESASVTPRVGVWIEIFCRFTYQSFFPCHSPCGSVDWNIDMLTMFDTFLQCHSPCRSVDWNKV